MDEQQKVLVVCGPTASGKSAIADSVADSLTRHFGSYVPVFVIDSMQVYRELPIITNQPRNRKAEMTGVASVADEWTMAHHKSLVESSLESTDNPAVLDAGTGMYLNSILLDIEVAPKVPSDVRRLAKSLTKGEKNPRRSAREKELELQGTPKRRSIWEGNLRYKTYVVYLRPEREQLREHISVRSAKIAEDGIGEIENLLDRYDYEDINRSVRDSIGFKELYAVWAGEISRDEAITEISSRTYKLAKRQIRWFDKLLSILDARGSIATFEHPSHFSLSHTEVINWNLFEFE